MKMGPVVLGGGAAVVAGLYLAGRLPGFGTADTLPDPHAQAGQAADAGRGVLTQLGLTGVEWPMIVVPLIVAALLVATWRRIGGFGRGAVIALGAIVTTVLVTR